MKTFVRGDIDGFFGLALDNLVQILLIIFLCRTVLEFDDALIFGKIMPGIALSLLLGNCWYSWQAKKLAEKSGQEACALPYGLNTLTVFVHVFCVMLPAKLAALGQEGIDPVLIAWQAGLVAALGSGLIEFGGAFVAERIRKATPRAALLSTLAGIAMTFIAMTFLFRTFAHPVVGLATLGVVLLTYFGQFRFRFNIPGGLVAVVLGMILAMARGLVPGGDVAVMGWQGPQLALDSLGQGLGAGFFLDYFAVILPMGIFNVIGSLQNIESAEAAGDSYQTQSSLAVNGLGTMVGACFGSCFPTTIYIGHPGWRAMGARIGYSALNGVVMTVLCLGGLLGLISAWVPVDAGMAIVLWIGIVISAQAFQATPRAHAPAVVMGFLPAVAAWGCIMIKNSLRIAGHNGFENGQFAFELIPAFEQADMWVTGAFALEQGFIFTCMILSACTAHLIDGAYRKAGLWCFMGALLSLTGIMHSYQYQVLDVVMALGEPAMAWALGYALMGFLFCLAPFLGRRSES